MRTAVLSIAALLTAGGATLAYAADPRPDNPGGATLTVDTASVVQGTTITFSGTGFATAGRGEVLGLKIDDGAVLLADKTDVFGTFTASSTGAVTGTVDLARASAVTPIAPGTHWIRVLVGSLQSGDTPRSLHANFTVTAPVTATPVPGATGPTPTPGPGGATPTTPLTASTAPTLIQTGPAWLTSTTLRRTASQRKVAIGLQAGGLGGAGRITLRTKHAVRLGAAKAKRQVLARSDTYFVDKISTERLYLTLTAEGRKLISASPELAAIVGLVDAGGESTVIQEVVIDR